MKKFIEENLFKYIFVFLLFRIIGHLYKSFDIDALCFVCGLIIWDIVWYLFKKYKKRKDESYPHIIRSEWYKNNRK